MLSWMRGSLFPIASVFRPVQAIWPPIWQDRREETRQKIILGAEVAKVLNIKPEEINKALVLGLLSKINELDEEEKRDFTRIGMDILQQWKS